MNAIPEPRMPKTAEPEGRDRPAGMAMDVTEIVKGSLKGMGNEIEVMLLATRHHPPKNHGPEYSRCCVLEVSSFLPDGYYEVTFCGHSAFVQNAGGCWSEGIPWVEIADAAMRPRELTAMEWIQDLSE